MGLDKIHESVEHSEMASLLAMIGMSVKKLANLIGKKLRGKDLEEFKTWKAQNMPMKKWKEKKSLERLAKVYQFTLHLISAMGPKVIRGIPRYSWHLRIKTPEGIRSWYLEGDPIRVYPLGSFYEGIMPDKYFRFEGKLDPKDTWNPFAYKKLEATVKILDKGKVHYKSRGIPEVIDLDFKGKLLTGKWRLTQAEKKSDMYDLQKLSFVQLRVTEFVLHRHWIPTDETKVWHYDVRILKDGILDEFNIYPVEDLELWEAEEGDSFKAVRKTCYEVKEWFIKEGEGIKRKVGRLWTSVDVLDYGRVNIIEDTAVFQSMEFYGKKLKGYWVAKKTDVDWRFIKSSLPSPKLTKETTELSGNPITGEYYKPFKMEKKRGWDYFWLRMYDMKKFTRCEEEEKARTQYLKGIDFPKAVQEVLVCLASRPGTLPLARVAAVKFSDEWDVETATKWITKNALHTWSRAQIREERKSQGNINNHGNSIISKGGRCESTCLLENPVGS